MFATATPVVTTASSPFVAVKSANRRASSSQRYCDSAFFRFFVRGVCISFCVSLCFLHFFVEGMTRYVFSLPNARSYYIH